MENIVVVGAGQAGASLVARLRAKGFTGSVTLLGEEPQAPYQRPPLSKGYLLGEMPLERLLLRAASFYEEQGIALKTGTRVSAIDRAAKTVRLADGTALPYDALALTTGSRPRMLAPVIGGDLAGLYPVRGLADVDAMAAEFREGARALIVGGGYIGLEAAAVASRLGLKVTLLEAAPRILQRVASPETSAWFRALHLARGVDLREGMGLSKLLGRDGRVCGAELADGSVIEADFAIIGIGIHPDVALADAAGIALDNGIAVDAHGRTSDPSVYAAGDCASFPYRGHRIRLESVQNAIDQAEAVADAMLGDETPYVPKPWFWSDQYDVKLQIAGLNTGYDRVVVRPGAREGTQSVWYFHADTLLAVDAMNDPRAYMQAKRWIEAGISPAPEAVADPANELKTLV
ncbi:pyridine nucleotide-disulfide oxidoreductase [Paroceanicella profunda]|uniref:Pyridine nucleotide-disulfide oxidoreductase n=1 Tax=Paroceanicella profunda TaxID=2579971 RepID=A0A5B8FUD5_9RHOB|nr:FAD-dependent oxidoreductase [Paroceanicella profunda]QDL91995.1 pyridine nucleotide-disulfide oxidoreductase [Paroceanicella profunda]